VSQVAAQARGLADALLPRERHLEPPRRADVALALDRLHALVPVDAHDEIAIGEAAEMLLRLRDLSAG
jgi:hypothetical protein